jgi:hypothetical protein
MEVDTRFRNENDYVWLEGWKQPRGLFETIDEAEAAGPRANDEYHKRNYLSYYSDKES